MKVGRKGRRPRALGAYIFAGGFTVGVSQHFDVACHLEETDYGVATVKHNMPYLPVHYGIENWPLKDLVDGPQIDFLYGNPPCAAWSQAGRSTVQGGDWRVDPRVDCTRRHFELMEGLYPTVWAWESVVPAFVKGRPFVDELTLRALDLGYSVTYLLHNSMYLGVPQRRRRFFFIAHKVEFDLEELSWGWQACLQSLRGINDVGQPLDHNVGRHKSLLSRVKPGEPLRDAWYRENPEPRRKNARGQNVGCPPLSITRARPDRPSGVVMHEMIHPTEDRALSVRELATLCGFPPGYEFINARDAGQIGRGVCPPVGEWLARNVARCIARGEPVTSPEVRLIDVREPPGSITALPRPDAQPEPEETTGYREEVRTVSEKQPSRSRQGLDPEREFDKTSLRANSHGQWVHRDYGAHFFRWGWAGRFVDGSTDVLDVGCGPDVPMINALTMPRNQVPRSYVGVDMNNEPNKHPTRQWAKLMWNFNFIARHKTLGQFDLITNFEVIEHMDAEDGLKLLRAMKACLRPDGQLLLSTPVFNGKAAANHIHEWTIDELKSAVAKAGLQVIRRFGTFASSKDIKKAASPAELDVMKRLSEYYSGEVLSCFLAPLYPDASRNNAWLLKRKD